MSKIKEKRGEEDEESLNTKIKSIEKEISTANISIEGFKKKIDATKKKRTFFLCHGSIMHE